MMISLLESIQEAAATLLRDTGTMSNDEIADILDEPELRELNMVLWDMVESVQ